MEIDRSLAAFIDLPDEKPLEVVDRSTLEHFADCPAQAVAILHGRCNTDSVAAATGEEIHKAFSAAVSHYLAADLNDWNVTRQVADEMESALRSSRPDVQPMAIQAAKRTCWAWARYLAGDREHAGMHPDNILRYDGGAGDRSGQLAYDMPDLGLRLTSELDFLASSKSPAVLTEVDWKTGWKAYYLDDIYNRFQFQFHAVLVLNTYPDIEALQLQVWEPRRGGLGYPVMFERKNLHEFETRVRNAAGMYGQYRDSIDDAPTWPSVEKCSLCPAAAICPAAGLPITALAENPASFVKELANLETKCDAMRDAAYQHVKATGADIVTDDGICFGRNKPRKETKANFSIYSLQKRNPKDAQGTEQANTVEA